MNWCKINLKIKECFKMPTIKDVAALAGVSISTVSFVLNGKSQKMKVSQSTQEKVTKAALALGYKPNANARKLRSSQTSKPVVAFYWPMDYRTNYLNSILDGLRNGIEKLSFDCELVICTYKYDNISAEIDLLDNYKYDVAIIGATSSKDTEYLEGLITNLPIILFNRASEKHSSVTSKEDEAIRNMIEFLSSKGHSAAALFCNKDSFVAGKRRHEFVQECCLSSGIHLPKSALISIDDSFEGGLIAARKYLALQSKPSCIISMTDTIALGAVYTLNRSSLSIPKDVEIFAIGIGDPKITMYSTPSLSIMEMPTVEMAENALSMAYNYITTGKPLCAESRKIAANLIFRESCPK